MPYRLATFVPGPLTPPEDDFIPVEDGGGGRSFTISPEDRLILGDFPLSDYPKIPEPVDNDNLLLRFIRDPKGEFAREIAGAELLFGDSPTLIFDYIQNSSSDSVSIQAFAYTNVALVSIPVTHDVMLDNEILNELDQVKYWEYISSLSNVSAYIKNLIHMRNEVSQRGLPENDIIHIREDDNGVVYSHFYIFPEKEIIEYFHYAMIRNPYFLEFLLNSPQYKKQRLEITSGSGISHDDPAYDRLKFRINRNKFRVIYQPKKYKDQNILGPCQHCTRYCGKMADSGRVMEIDTLVIACWVP